MMQDYNRLPGISTRILWKGLGLNLDNLSNYITLVDRGPFKRSTTVQTDSLNRFYFYMKHVLKHALKQSRIDEENLFLYPKIRRTKGHVTINILINTLCS